MLSWLDQLLFGVRKVFNEGTELPDRPAIKFAGAGVVASDDPTNNLTLVTIAGGGGGGGASLDVVTYDASVSATTAITRTGARMFIHAVGNFTALVLPFPTDGDEIVVKVTGLSGGTSLLVADPTRLLDGQTSYKFTADNQGLHLVYVAGAGWKIAAEIGIPGILELSGAGPFHNLDATGYRAIRFTNAASVTLTGLVPPPAGVHRRWSVTSTNGLTISHQSTSSDAGKRFDFFANSAKSVAGRTGVEFYYDHTTSYFRIDGYPDG